MTSFSVLGEPLKVLLVKSTIIFQNLSDHELIKGTSCETPSEANESGLLKKKKRNLVTQNCDF